MVLASAILVLGLSWALSPVKGRAAATPTPGRAGPVAPRAPEVAFRPVRVAELLDRSEELRQAGDQWERFWFLDQPSQMTPFRTHGGLGP